MEFLDKVGLTKLVELIKAAIKTADDKAVAAQTAAGAASTSAQAAQAAADTAQETAEAAQAAATTADGKADKAQAAADAADGKADKAQTTAEAAQAAATAAAGTAGNAMPKTGGTFTGAVSGVAPTEEANLTTKSYVDDAIASATAGVVVDTAISDADVTSIWNG